jgi:hypothetical protein
MGDITVRGRIEVMPGNKLMVPGCEPVSALTSTALDENRVCAVTVVDLSDALTAVPGSTVEGTYNPRRKWFVLPSGPAPDPSRCDSPGGCNSVPDWYAALRAIGNKTNIQQQEKPVDFCTGFPLRGIFG